MCYACVLKLCEERVDLGPVPETKQGPIDVGVNKEESFEGVVVDRRGDPVKGATVSLATGKGGMRTQMSAVMIAVGDGGSQMTFDMGGGDDSARTDAEGYFLLSGLPPGKGARRWWFLR